MKRLCILSAAVLCGTSASVKAQSFLGLGGTSTPVGKPVLAPVGQQFAPAAPKNGTAIGYRGPDGNPISSTPPPGKMVDLTNLAAPLTAPLPPGMGQQQKPFWQSVYSKWQSMLGLDKQASAPSPNWVPGLGRRTKERKEATWRRD